MGIADYLRDCGYRVVEADNGDEAVSVLESDARIDVVFTDITMPGTLNGFGLAQWVRRERPEVRVILTSGISRTAQEARDLCAHGPLVAKPYDYGEVERHIRTLLARP
jgi:CheY-like chemotaxis protein